MSVKKLKKKAEEKKAEDFIYKHYIISSFIVVFIIYVLTLFVFLFEETVLGGTVLVGGTPSYMCTRIVMSGITGAGFVSTVYGIRESVRCFQGLSALKPLAIYLLITGTGLSCVTFFMKIVR